MIPIPLGDELAMCRFLGFPGQIIVDGTSLLTESRLIETSVFPGSDSASRGLEHEQTQAQKLQELANKIHGTFLSGKLGPLYTTATAARNAAFYGHARILETNRTPCPRTGAPRHIDVNERIGQQSEQQGQEHRSGDVASEALEIRLP